jgi:hypothetical protein
MTIQKDISIALQNNDHVNAMAMVTAKQDFAREEAVKDRKVEYARVELQKRGIDMAELEARYSMLLEGGDPDSAFEYIQGEMNKHGITMNKADEDAAYQAIADDYRQQQFVYALSNPDMAVWVDGNGNPVNQGAPGAKFGGLRDEAAETFNNFLNTTYYGPDGLPQTGGQPIGPNENIRLEGTSLINTQTNKYLDPDEIGIALRGADKPENQNNETYQQLLNSAVDPDIRITSKTANRISGVPEQGKTLNIGGRLMIITKGQTRSKEGRNHDQFQIMDVATGAKKTFKGLSAGDNSVNNLNNWASALAA